MARSESSKFYDIRTNRPNEDAERDTVAAPRMIQSVSILVVSSKMRLTSAITIVTGSVSAWRASGIAAARSKPALATTTVCRVDFTEGSPSCVRRNELAG